MAPERVNSRIRSGFPNRFVLDLDQLTWFFSWNGQGDNSDSDFEWFFLERFGNRHRKRRQYQSRSATKQRVTSILQVGLEERGGIPGRLGTELAHNPQGEGGAANK